jgi:hypothetical protein
LPGFAVNPRCGSFEGRHALSKRAG